MTQLALPLTLGDRLRELAERYRAAGAIESDHWRERVQREIRIEACKAALEAGLDVDEAVRVVRRALDGPEQTRLRV